MKKFFKIMFKRFIVALVLYTIMIFGGVLIGGVIVKDTGGYIGIGLFIVILSLILSLLMALIDSHSFRKKMN